MKNRTAVNIYPPVYSKHTNPVSIPTSLVVVSLNGMAKQISRGYVYHSNNNATDRQAKATTNNMLNSREERQNAEPLLLIHLQTYIHTKGVQESCQCKQYL